MGRKLLWIGGLLVGVVVVGLAAVKVYARHEAQARVDEVIAGINRDGKAGLATFVKLEASLASEPFFTAVRPGGDAGPILNAGLPWDMKAGAAAPKLAFPEPLKKQLTDWGKGWVLHAKDLDTSGLDLGWMKELSAFGYWNMVANSPLSTLPEVSWATMPMPQYVQLLHWSKVRLLQGLASGAPQEAAAEVRHLAWLATSTETVIGGMVGLALLRLEERAHLAFVSGGGDPGAWKPISHETIETAKRVMLAAQLYADPKLPEEISAPALAAAKPSVGLCAALNEQVAVSSALKALEDKEVTPMLGRLDARMAAATPPCRLELSRLVIAKPSLELLRAMSDDSSRPLAMLLGTDMALVLLALSAPGGSGIKQLSEPLPANEPLPTLDAAPSPVRAIPPAGP